MLGGVSSVTAIDRLHVEALPQSSEAVQVRVTVNSCGQLPGVVTFEKVMLTLASQASVAVAGGNVGVAGHSIEGVTVGQVIAGAVSSTTDMALLQDEAFPQSSEAVQVRVTVYSCG